MYCNLDHKCAKIRHIKKYHDIVKSVIALLSIAYLLTMNKEAELFSNSFGSALSSVKLSDLKGMLAFFCVNCLSRYGLAIYHLLSMEESVSVGIVCMLDFTFVMV